MRARALIFILHPHNVAVSLPIRALVSPENFVLGKWEGIIDALADVNVDFEKRILTSISCACAFYGELSF